MLVGEIKKFGLGSLRFSAQISFYHATPSQIQATHKQAGKRSGAFFVSLVLHLAGALIATAYVVQEKIANEELMQGVLMKPVPKPTLKRRSRPRVAKTTTPRKAIATPKP